MLERRKRIMKRLLVEELERRELLAGMPEIAMAATGLTTNSLQDFYKSVVGTEIGGPAGVYMVDEDIQPALTGLFFATVDVDSNFADSLVPDADSGVGQQTITTGANTPGIGSFATPTAGPSRAGGTGNLGAPLAGDLATRDEAIDKLFGDSEEEPAEKADSEAEPANIAERGTREPTMLGSRSTARRAYNIEPDKMDAEEATPAAAGANQ